MSRQEKINKALDELDGFKRQLEGLDERMCNVETDLENLIWEDMEEKGILTEEQIEKRKRYPRSPELIIYTDRVRECTAESPTGHCVEMGWHDACIYCRSLRDED
jgi:hypothetical protein